MVIFVIIVVAIGIAISMSKKRGGKALASPSGLKTCPTCQRVYSANHLYCPHSHSSNPPAPAQITPQLDSSNTARAPEGPRGRAFMTFYLLGSLGFAALIVFAAINQSAPATSPDVKAPSPTASNGKSVSETVLEVLSDDVTKGQAPDQSASRPLDRMDNFKQAVKILEDQNSFKDLDSMDGISAALKLFSADARLYESNWINLSVEERKSRDKLRVVLASVQQRVLPRLRKKWTALISQKMWEKDVRVTTAGRRSETIVFVGGMFAANSNKKAVYDDLLASFKNARFRKSVFKWVDEDNSYAYWEITSPSDSQMAVFDTESIYHLVYK